MKTLTGIFFKMNTFNSYSSHLRCFIWSRHVNFNLAVFANRFIELGNLVAFNQVGIKVMFPVKFAEFVDRTAKCKARLNTEFNIFVADKR